MMNVILLWSDSLLRIKIVKVIAFFKNASKDSGRFFMIIFMFLDIPGCSGMFRDVPCSRF